MTSSATYSYNPSLADIVLDAFERIGVLPASITPDHMKSATRSLNQISVRWSNRGVNLWCVDLQTVQLDQGVATYSVPTSTVAMREAYIRNYNLGTPEDLTVDFSTVSTSTTVTIGWPDHGLSVSEWLSINIPVSVGGIVLSGYYQVESVPTSDSITITASDTATSTVNNGGAVPEFSTVAQSTTITVVLADNGYSAGDPFMVQVQTTVGGIILSGLYTIATIVDPDTFTLTSAYVAGSTETVSENDGQAQLAGQTSSTGYTDRLITPISRTDYAATANKETQGPPTSYYFQRTINPTVTLWPVPDQNGPYELRYYRSRQLQDANPQSGETADIPYRLQEAFVAEVSAHLATKWRPDQADARYAYANQCWEEASTEDREHVSINMSPDAAAYWS